MPLEASSDSCYSQIADKIDTFLVHVSKNTPMPQSRETTTQAGEAYALIVAASPHGGTWVADEFLCQSRLVPQIYHRLFLTLLLPLSDSA